MDATAIEAHRVARNVERADRGRVADHLGRTQDASDSQIDLSAILIAYFVMRGNPRPIERARHLLELAADRAIISVRQGI